MKETNLEKCYINVAIFTKMIVNFHFKSSFRNHFSFFAIDSDDIAPKSIVFFVRITLVVQAFADTQLQEVNHQRVQNRQLIFRTVSLSRDPNNIHIWHSHRFKQFLSFSQGHLHSKLYCLPFVVIEKSFWQFMSMLYLTQIINVLSSIILMYHNVVMLSIKCFVVIFIPCYLGQVKISRKELWESATLYIYNFILELLNCAALSRGERGLIACLILITNGFRRFFRSVRRRSGYRLVFLWQRENSPATEICQSIFSLLLNRNRNQLI